MSATVCVYVCVGGFLASSAPAATRSNHTHCNWTHTLERILFRFHFFLVLLLLLLLLWSSCFWLVCLLPAASTARSSSHLVLLYAFGFGVVDIKCKTEFHFRQECSSAASAAATAACCCCCCYWECYNIVEACNILPRIRVGIHPILTHTLLHIPSHVLRVCVCVVVDDFCYVSFSFFIFQHIFSMRI